MQENVGEMQEWNWMDAGEYWMEEGRIVKIHNRFSATSIIMLGTKVSTEILSTRGYDYGKD